MAQCSNSQLLLNNIWISRVIPGTWLWRITVYSLSWINWGRRCIAAPLPALIRTGSSNQAKCDLLRWVAVCLCTSVGRDGVCQWGLNDPHRARQAWISLFPLPLRCSLWEDHWMVEVYKRVESERWHGLSRLSKLRGRNGKQERESAEREKMTEKKEENIEGGKAKRKHRDRCERKYIQSQKCFIED